MSDRHHQQSRRRRFVIGQLAASDESPGRPVVGPWPDEHETTVNSPVDDEFRAACAVAGAVVVTVCHRERQDDDRVHYIIRRPSVLIGRGHRCDISLQDPTVSYRHAYLQLLDRQLFCFDLASRTGTFCHSDRHRSGPLALGEEIYVGPYSLVMSIEEPNDGEESDVTPPSPDAAPPGSDRHEDRPAASPADETAATSDTVLKFLNGSPRPEPLALNRSVTLIGKSRRCRITLADDSVSRVHCSIVRTRTGVWVVDLLGKGGTLVGGEPVERAPLSAGDELTVGRFRMQVLAAAASRALSRSKAEISRTSHRPVSVETPGSPERNRLSADEERHGRGPRPTPITQPETETSPAGADTSTISESFIISLVDQIASMQHQMFEQSQQTMAAVAEIFRTRHEADVQLVRDEMAHIRDLSHELQGLSRQLAECQPEDIREGRVQKSGFSGETGFDPRSQLQERDAPAPSEDADPVAEDRPAEEPHAPAAAPAVPESIPTASPTETAADVPAGRDRSGVGTEQQAPPEGRPVLSGAETSAPEPAAAYAASADESDTAGDDPHLWLSQRIAALEKERNSRWQKITRILTDAAAADHLT